MCILLQMLGQKAFRGVEELDRSSVLNYGDLNKANHPLELEIY